MCIKGRNTLLKKYALIFIVLYTFFISLYTMSHTSLPKTFHCERGCNRAFYNEEKRRNHYRRHHLECKTHRSSKRSRLELSESDQENDAEMRDASSTSLDNDGRLTLNATMLLIKNLSI